MPYVYEYYIWDKEDNEDDDTLSERIEKALTDAGLEWEYNRISDY